MNPGRPSRSEAAANAALSASAATIGAHALKPAPVRARAGSAVSHVTRPGRVLRALLGFFVR